MPTLLAIAEATRQNAQDRNFQIGDRVDVHGEVGVITAIKRDGKAYNIRFHYGTVNVEESDIEGIANHVSNASDEDLCKGCGHERHQHEDGKCVVKDCGCANFELRNANGWPTPLKCSFIEPGVVLYQDVGMVLVQKTVLDKMANSMRGKPVINVDHREVSPDDFRNGNADGIVDGNEQAVWFDPTDAKYHCSFQVTTPATLTNIKNGFKVSCAYKVTKWGPGGIHNNVPYEREVLDGEYTHLAIVANPRYEGVRIYNDKGANKMKLLWWRKEEKDGKVLENSTEIETSKSVVEVDGKEVSLDNCIAAFQELEAKKLKELENKGPADTDLIDIGGGKKVTIADLRNAYKAKNEADEEAEKKKKEKEAKDAEERKNAEDKKKMDEEHEEGKHEKDEKENCARCNALKNARNTGHFQRVENLANSRPSDFTDTLPEHFDGIAEGRKRFGSEPASKK